MPCRLAARQARRWVCFSRMRLLRVGHRLSSPPAHRGRRGRRAVVDRRRTRCLCHRRRTGRARTAGTARMQTISSGSGGRTSFSSSQEYAFFLNLFLSLLLTRPDPRCPPCPPCHPLQRPCPALQSPRQNCPRCFPRQRPRRLAPLAPCHTCQAHRARPPPCQGTGRRRPPARLHRRGARGRDGNRGQLRLRPRRQTEASGNPAASVVPPVEHGLYVEC